MVTVRAPALTVVLAAALACAGTLSAQTLEPAGSLDQIAPAASRADRTASGQIGTPNRSVSAGEISPDADRSAPGSAPAQLARPGDAAAPAQLAPAGRSARGSTQLSDGPRSAQPPPPLSSPKDGRTGAIARVDGRDRCDSASASASASASVGNAEVKARGKAAKAPGHGCAAVIETRGAEFPPLSVEPLSPEQRLLVEQRVLRTRGTEPGSIARTASQRVGRDGADADAPQMQGIASVVLAPAAPAQGGDPTAGLTADQAALATSVLGALDGTQP